MPWSPTGTFTYHGDNRSPGRELHDTPNKGNLLLSRAFEWAHADQKGRYVCKPNRRGDGHDRLNGDPLTVHIMFPAAKVPGAAQILLGHSQTAVTRRTGARTARCGTSRLTPATAPRCRIEPFLEGI